MTIEEAICDRLLAMPEVVAAVGNRVYLLIVRQNSAMPAIRVQPISEAEEYHTRGAVATMQTRLQIDVFASVSNGGDPYAEAGSLAEAVAGRWRVSDPTPPDGLSGWTGMIGGDPPTIWIRLIKRLARQAIYEPDVAQLIRIRQDFNVVWTRL